MAGEQTSRQPIELKEAGDRLNFLRTGKIQNTQGQWVVPDRPVEFPIERNPQASETSYRISPNWQKNVGHSARLWLYNISTWQSEEQRGQAAVDRYGPLIDKIAKREKMDPLLLRAVTYVENAKNPDPPSWWGVNNTRLPMNIHPGWASLLKKEDLVAAKAMSETDEFDLKRAQQAIADHPQVNILAAARLLKVIARHVPAQPSDTALDRMEKTASIYSFFGRERVNDYGKHVGAAYKRFSGKAPPVREEQPGHSLGDPNYASVDRGRQPTEEVSVLPPLNTPPVQESASSPVRS